MIYANVDQMCDMIFQLHVVTLLTAPPDLTQQVKVSTITQCLSYYA